MALPIVFNIAKGFINFYASVAGVGNAAIIAVPIELTGLESDAVLKDYATLSALLASTNNEQTTMGRKTITSATLTVDNTLDEQRATIANITWALAAGNEVGALLLCFDPDTTSGTDTTIVPITKYDWPVTPVGTDITAIVAADGVWKAED